MTPKQAITFEKMCRLQTDNFDTGDYWISTDEGKVSIYEQRSGEASKQNISVARKDFNRLIGWYLRDQKPRKK